MSWTEVQKTTSGPISANAASVTGTLPAGSTAGNLLVAFVSSSENHSLSGPAGWLAGPAVSNGATAQTQIFYYPGNPGGISSAQFTSSSGTPAMRCELVEFSNSAGSTAAVNLVASGTQTGALVTNITVTNGQASAATALACCVFLETFTAGTAITWTDPSGFTVAASQSSSSQNHLYSAYDLTPSAGTLSVTGTSSVQSTQTWAGCVACFDFTSAPVAAVALAAPAGSLEIDEPGPTATVALAAPAGSVSADATVTGVTATVALAAPAGGATPPTTATGVPATVALAAPAGSVTATSFQVPIDLDVDLNLAGAWTDVSTYVLQRDGSTLPKITRGRNPESPSPVAATLAAELNNRDYRFNPHNPTGAYYPSLGRNTPIRVSVPGPSARLRMEDDSTSYCSTPAIDVDGTLTLSIDLKLSNWTASVLASQWSAAAGNFSWAFLLDADGHLQFWYSTDGSTIVTAESTQPLPWPGGRISLQVVYAESTGVVTFGYATSIGGSYTQLGAAVATGTTGAVYESTAAIQVGANTYFAGLPGYLGTYAATPISESWAPAAYQGLVGSVYEMQLYDGAALVADPQFLSQPGGTTSFADAQGNTWTCAGTAAVSARAYRFHGEISEWPPRWDETGTDIYIPVVASGLLRRLQQKAAPIGSTMTRAWKRKTGTYAPVAYWPCEDGNNSQVVTLGLVTSSSSQPTQIASGLAGGQAMQISGSRKTTFASSSATDFLCTSPLPIPHTDVWTGNVAPYTQPASPANVIRFLLDIPSGGDTNGLPLVRAVTLGTVAMFEVLYQSGGALELLGYDGNDNQLFSSGPVSFGGSLAGVPCLCEMAITTHGTGITWHLNTLTLATGAQTGLSGNLASASAGIVTQIVVNPDGDLGFSMASAVGQISVQSAYAAMDSATSADALIGPLNAWAGEPAGLRFARLCAEQGYACRITGNPATTVPMGPQSPQTFVSLLQEVESADHGVIYEPRTALAYAYRCSSSLAAQASAISGAQPLVLTYTSAHLGEGAGKTGIEPNDDDQLTVNDELATRGSGSVTGSLFEATATGAQYSATAALSIAAPPNGVGLYQDAQTVNVWTDSQLGDQASWLVHLGTVSELRYPTIPVNLARTELAALVNTVAEVDVGDYLQIASPPAQLSPDAVKQLIWGYTETLGGFTWVIVWQGRPESPWEVLVLGSGAAGDCRADTDGSTLASAYSAVATSLSVETAAGYQPWITGSASPDFPFGIIVAGERMTVTAIANATSPQTFTVTRAVNGVSKSQASGAVVNLFQPCYLALT